MMNRPIQVLASLGLLACASACGSNATGNGATSAPPSTTPDVDAGTDVGPTLASSIEPITRADQAQPRTFIPPFKDCRAPLPGDTTTSASGKVCTQVGLPGATEPGKYYPDYASCDVIRTQRPYWPADPAGASRADDPRLQDPAFMKELSWVTEQARATACTCCHDSKQAKEGPSQWAIDSGPIWTDTASDAAIALFAGLADSSIFGAFDAKDNNGFQRSTTGLPSDDGDRMRAFFVSELARRGISPEKAAAFPPFGGPLYTNMHTAPTACASGEGIDASGTLTWDASTKARYVYVLETSAQNPGVPPNFDRPTGTLWRLDVLASHDALTSGITYGATPPGSFQSIPATGRAPALEAGKTYHLYVLRDVAVVATNCLFTYAGK